MTVPLRILLSANVNPVVKKKKEEEDEEIVVF
jgi:hypothetical protein